MGGQKLPLILIKKPTKGEGGGLKIQKMGRRRLWTAPKLLMHKILCCPQLPQLHNGGKLKPVLIVKIAIFWSYFHQNAANPTKRVKMVQKDNKSNKNIYRTNRIIRF